MPKETRNIGKNLSKPQLKKKLSAIKWRSDHRGINYNKKTGVVTAV